MSQQDEKSIDDEQPYGDVISTVPPGLQIEPYPVKAQDRNISFAVNPAAVLGTLQNALARAGIVPLSGINYVQGAFNLPTTDADAVGVYAGETANAFLAFRNLAPGSGVFFTTDVDGDIIINATVNTLANEGAGTGFVFDATVSGVSYLRTLAADPATANAGISVATVGQEIEIGNTMTGANLGGGVGTVGLFSAKTAAGVLQFFNVTPGTGVNFTRGGSGDVIINSTGGGGGISALANEGSGTGLVFDSITGTTANLRSLESDASNPGILIATSGQVVTIGNTLVGQNLGSGSTVYAGRSGVDLQFNSLAAGVGISVSAPSSGAISIASTITGSSIGAGDAVYAGQSGATLQFKGLVAGAGITLTPSGTDITIASATVGNEVLQGGNAFGVTMVVGTTDANDLELIAAGSVVVTFAHLTLGATFAAGVTAHTLASTTTVTVGSSLRLVGSTSGNALSMAAAAATAAYSLTWPGAQGGVSTVLVNDGSGNLSWATNPGGNYFLVGGNTTAADAVLGTLNAHQLILETNGLPALTLSVAQNALFAGSVTAAGGLQSGANGGAAGSLALEGSASGSVTLQAGASVTAYVLTLPTAQGAANTVLTNSDGAGTLTWATNPFNAFIQGGNAFGALAVLGTTDAHSLELIAQGAAVLTLAPTKAATFTGTVAAPSSLTLGTASATSGSLVLQSSGSANTLTIQAPAALTTYALTLPGSQGAANSVLTDNGAGVLSWATNPSNAFVQGGNSFGATATLGTNDANILNVRTGGLTALTIDPSQNVSTVNAFTAPALVLKATNSATLTQNVSGTMTTYAITWPAAPSAVAEALLTSNASGVLSWTNPNGASGVFLQGGNAFSATAVLGTTDSHQLSFITGGIQAAYIDTSQNLNLNQSLIFYGTSSGSLTMSVPAVVAPYSITWPAAVSAVAESILTSNASGVLSWTDPSGATGFFRQGGNAFGAAAVLGTTDANQLDFVTGGASNVAAFIDTSQNFNLNKSLIFHGSTSGTLTVSVPATVTSYAVTWPGAVATITGQALTSTTSGALSWTTAFLQGGNSFGGASSAAVLGPTDATSTLRIITANTTALTIGATQNATFAGSGTFQGGSLTLGVPVTTAGQLNLAASGAGGGTFAMKAAASSASYTITWPAAVSAVAEGFLTSSTLGIMSWTNPNSGATGIFLQGGNAFGATAVLGTTDANQLSFVTGGASNVAAFIDTSQNFNLNKSLIFHGSTSGTLTVSVPATITSYAVTWPGAVATVVGQALTSDTGGVLSWTTAFLQGGNSFGGAGATAVLGPTDATSTLQIITANTTALTISATHAVTFADSGTFQGGGLTLGVPVTTAGQLNLAASGAGGGTFAMNAAASSTSYTVTWPAAVSAVAQGFLTSNTSGVLSWTNPNSGATGVFLQGGNSFGATATLGTNDANNLILRAGGTTAVTISNVTQNAVFAANSTIQGGILTLGVVGTASGVLVIEGATTGALQMRASSSGTATTYSITWPSAISAVAEAFLTSNTAGALTWTDPNSSTNGVFLQGGNNFGATATLGTADASSLRLKAGNTVALTISGTTQAVIMSATATVQGGTLTLGVASTTGGSLVIEGATAGALTMGAAASTTSYSLTWPAAAAATSGFLLSSTTGGVLSWVGGTASTLAYYNTSGVLASNSNVTVDSSGDITTTGIISNGNGFLDANMTTTQTINVGTSTSIQFPSVITNSIANLTLSVSNSVFTNTSAVTMTLNIGASISFSNATNTITQLAVWLTRSGTTRLYFQSVSYPSTALTTAVAAVNIAGTVQIAASETFSIMVFIQGSNSTYATGTNNTNRLNMITISRIS